MEKRRAQTPAARSAQIRYRRRMQARGVVRLEVQVNREDAGLVRAVAAALADPWLRSETRALLREQFDSRPSRGLKALLTVARP